MNRYFKIIEITRDEFIQVGHEDFNYQNTVYTANGTYIAVDDERKIKFWRRSHV